MQDPTQQDRVRIDLIIFKKGLTKQYLKAELGRANSLTDKLQWVLSDQNYVLYQIEPLFELFQEIEIHQLYLNRVALPPTKMFKFIHINFPVLTSLCLKDNNIVSIESMVHLNAINLSTLWLSSNRITQIRSLAKMFMPELQWLTLYNNPILEFQALQTLRAPKLQEIEIGFLLNGAQQSGDLRWLLKLQTNSIDPALFLLDFKETFLKKMLHGRYHVRVSNI